MLEMVNQIKLVYQKKETKIIPLTSLSIISDSSITTRIKTDIAIPTPISLNDSLIWYAYLL